MLQERYVIKIDEYYFTISNFTNFYEKNILFKLLRSGIQNRSRFVKFSFRRFDHNCGGRPPCRYFFMCLLQPYWGGRTVAGKTHERKFYTLDKIILAIYFLFHFIEPNRFLILRAFLIVVVSCSFTYVGINAQTALFADVKWIRVDYKII